MARCVLDTSALIAVLRGEPGADRAEPLFDGAVISAVNAAEVLSRQALRGSSVLAVRRWLNALPVRIEPFQGAQLDEVARLRPLTQHLGLSLADRACVALGRLLRRPVVTSDRAWRKLKIGVEVELIR